jgi:hypothetical protein
MDRRGFRGRLAWRARRSREKVARPVKAGFDEPRNREAAHVFPYRVLPISVLRFWGVALTGAPALAAADFYVVLGSFNTESGQAAVEAGETLMKRGRRCGFDVWTEHSSKIRGFAPGYYLALTGPYPAARRGGEHARPHFAVRAGGLCQEPGRISASERRSRRV